MIRLQRNDFDCNSIHLITFLRQIAKQGVDVIDFLLLRNMPASLLDFPSLFTNPFWSCFVSWSNIMQPRCTPSKFGTDDHVG
ncbi:hypothetical protein HanRHA438_Chr04g0157181 [Helianthus annuus]|nr:hypothetical protein HanRHA438_Chr04g0157181 [Helianthus annuus]